MRPSFSTQRSSGTFSSQALLSDESTIGEVDARRPGRTVDKVMRKTGTTLELLIARVSRSSLFAGKTRTKLSRFPREHLGQHDEHFGQIERSAVLHNVDAGSARGSGVQPALFIIANPESRFEDSVVSATNPSVNNKSLLERPIFPSGMQAPTSAAESQSHISSVKTSRLSPFTNTEPAISDSLSSVPWTGSRPRLEDLVRCTHHWHDHAVLRSVVLLAERTMFKVQPSILGEASDLLSDFLSEIRLHRPMESREMQVDGWDVLPLPHVCASDLIELLDQVYSHNDVTSSGRAEAHLRSIALIVIPVLQYSMGTGRFPKLCSKSIELLEWAVPFSDMGLLTKQHDIFLYSSTSDGPFRFLRAVLLAEAYAQHLLPFSFFLCAKAPIGEIMGTPCLEDSVKVLCLAGRQHLSHVLAFEVYREYLDAAHPMCPETCSEEPQCAPSFKDADALRKFLSSASILNDFFTKVGDVACCQTCSTEMQNKVELRWQECRWESLPQALGLGMKTGQ